MGFVFLPPNPNNIFLSPYNILKCEACRKVILYQAYKVNINRMEKQYKGAKRQDKKLFHQSDLIDSIKH